LIRHHHYSPQTVCSNPSWMHGRRKANKRMVIWQVMGSLQDILCFSVQDLVNF
jgi:hypothetical protein